jgi:hypothetical protein
VPALGKYKVCVATSEQVEEINNAPIDHLSFNAAIDEVGSAWNGSIVNGQQANVSL